MNEPDVLSNMISVPPRSIAVIGLSADPQKPSHYVPGYMQQHGYRIFPVNPSIESVLGEKSWGSLTELVSAGHKPDIVEVFRVPGFIPAIVDEMLALGLGNLWVQQGIVNLEAALKAEAGGIRVVMDRCLMVEHRHLAA